MTQSAQHLSAVAAGRLKPMSQAELRSVASELKEFGKQHPGISALLADELPLKDFVLAALTLSPFLRDTVRIDPELLERALSCDVPQRLAEIVRDARAAWKNPVDGSPVSEAQIMTSLRRAKREFSFLTALADLGGIFDGRETTRQLSAFATACVAAAIDHLLLATDDSGKLTLKDRAEPSRGSGLIILGMGKLGAGELNYSSDIDLVAFFEPEAGVVVDPDEATEVFARLMRRLLRVLQERTADGYVFRTDLRLRPDPGSTPLAIPVDAAIHYYEGRGQNWERAAFIKARAVGGDIEAGTAFLAELQPFVFRKYLDYAAIADIHSIKRQIHAHKGFGLIAVKGHNVKLGRGGIREIEFFVQTQQLIAGGRMKELRLQSTEAMLAALAKARWIDDETRDQLTDAYWFLRNVEHRIQMVHDEQTHILPETDAELKRIALMMGFDTVKAFSAALLTVLRTVELRYAALFEQESGLSDGIGNLVFTGQNDDPDTLETLSRLGFQRPSDISRTIRTWHYGRYRATQSVEARERLTELTPKLLETFGATRRADEALLQFDRFIAGLPAGIQLFSLLSTNPGLLSLIVTIMSSAPRLADIIARRPHVFDGMLDPGLLSELPTRTYLAERIKSFVSASAHYEESLDRLRIIAAEQRFLIGVRLLTGSISGAQAATAFTHLADLILDATLTAVCAHIESSHGLIPGGRVAILGMGKLGNRELTAGSDIDLIVLYDHDEDAVESDGAKPLDPARYYARLTQRLIAALSAPTGEGVLYEVDMRLRPSGNKGPIASRLPSFAAYQRDEAWTWEHMALTRARPVCGDAALMGEMRELVRQIVLIPRDVGKTAKDVLDMRLLIDQEKPPLSLWDLKLVAGGLIDLEFLAQYFALVATSYGNGAVIAEGTTTVGVLRGLGAAMLDAEDLDLLLSAGNLLTELTQMTRLCIDGIFDPKDAPSGLVDLVCRAGDCPDLKTLEAEIRRLAKAVRRILLASLKGAGRVTGQER